MRHTSSSVSVTLDGRTLKIEDVVAVARQFAAVTLSDVAAERVERAHRLLTDLIKSGEQIYGVTTGLADHKGMPVRPEEIEGFQRRIVLSHVVGVGPALPSDVVRAIMVARANTLASGGSGARRQLIDLLVVLLNHRIHPRVPSKGSLGVTDLTHLAHIAQVVLGIGEAEVNGKLVSANQALSAAGIQPARLGPKEGLALISANAGSAGRGALVLWDLERLVGTMDVAAALSVEAFRANTAPFGIEIEQAHPDPGQATTAAHLRALLAGSDLDQPGAARSIQDPYSFRCVPQNHGALRNALEAARTVTERELNSAADTPLVAVETGRVISNGNFLVIELALAFEHLAIALAHASSFSAARTRALMSQRMTGLPGTLITSPSPQTGLSILQEAVTNLQTGIRLRANPSSLDFNPIADGVEDHATNAMDAVAKLESSVADAALILGAEFMTAAQAVELRGSIRLGAGTRAANEAIRHAVPFLKEDAPLAPFIEALGAEVQSGALLEAAEAAIRPAAAGDRGSDRRSRARG
jgi:histidine ammonia-lyase